MRYRVVVDPGHGGSDPGRVVGTAKEAAIALRVAKLLVDELAERDILCTLTRWDDVYVKLSDRAAKANAANADLFISVHCNGAGSEAPRGPQVIYCNGSELGERAANVFQRALESVIPKSDQSGVFPDASAHVGFTKDAQEYFDRLPHSLGWQERIRRTALVYKGDTFRTLAVLRRTNMPAVLLELGFLTNDEDRAKLTNGEMQRAFASAVADATVRWLDAQDGVE